MHDEVSKNKSTADTVIVHAPRELKWILIIGLLILFLIFFFSPQPKSVQLQVLIYSALTIAGVLSLDWTFRYYVLDKQGFHQHWFFHTDHYGWSDFEEIYLLRDRKVSKTLEAYLFCFDCGISRADPWSDRRIHPFRFFVFEERIPGHVRSNDWWYVDRGEILLFFERQNIHIEIRD